MADRLFGRKRRPAAVWVLVPLCLALYLFLFPRPCDRETFVQPVWAEPLPAPGPLPHSSGLPLFPFRLGERFGYADLEGEFAYLGTVLHGLALGSEGFINYGPVADHLVFMDPGGRFQFSIQDRGYPLLDQQGRILYSVATDLTALERLDRDGQPLWSLAFASPLTTVALAGKLCAVGLLSGEFLVLSAEGRPLYRHAFADSRIPVILGSAASPDGELIAVLHGVEPQQLLVLRRRGGDYFPQAELELSSDYRREVRLVFGAARRFLYYETPSGLGVLDVQRSRTRLLASGGKLWSIDGNARFEAAAFNTEAGFRLLLFRPMDAVLLDRRLPASELSLKVIGSSLIIGLDGFLLRADVVDG